MPSLVWCWRKWRIGSDDFALFGAVFAAVHFVFAVILLPFVSSDEKLQRYCAGASTLMLCSLRLICFMHWMCTAFFAVLASLSFRGRIFEVSKRKHVPTVLSLVCFLCVCEIVFSSLAAHALRTGDAERCRNSGYAPFSRFLVAVVVINFILSGSFVWKILINFDPSGKLKPFTTVEEYETFWSNRCRLLCCCCLPDGDDEEQTLRRVASVVAFVFQGHDLVPTDISAAFLLLREYQRSVQHEYKLAFQYPNVPHLKPSRQARRFHTLTEAHRAVVRRIVRNNKFCLGTFGWMWQVHANPCCGLCLLWCHDCCMCCRQRNYLRYGETCYCDSTALMRETNLTDDDIVLTHFDNKLHQPSYYVAVDHADSIQNWETLVIAVRGTMSFIDALTDSDAVPERIQLRECENAFVHAGMLKSATNILAQLRSHGIIHECIQKGGKFANHRILVCGQSLGAGVAAVLAVLMRDAEPSLAERLHCLSYSPPGAVFSRSLSEFSASFVTASMVGQDLVPRMSLQTMADLRDSMLHVLACTGRSKASILVGGACCPRNDSELLHQRNPFTEAASILQAQYLASPLRRQTSYPPEQGIPMFPPSNMVLFAKATTVSGCCSGPDHSQFCPAWIDINELREIECTPHMVLDHMPDRCLAIYKETLKNLEAGKLEDYVFPDALPRECRKLPRSLMYLKQRSGATEPLCTVSKS